MRQRLRSHLTYANVMVTLLAFIVLGGGTAVAAFVVSSNSQIGPGTVSGHKPPTGKHANVIAGSVNGQDVAANSLTGAKILESSLGRVPSATLGGLGGDSGSGAICDPESAAFITCAQVSTTLPAPARVLIIGQISARPETLGNTAFGICRVGSNFGFLPESTAYVFVKAEHDSIAMSGVTDVLGPGPVSFELDCAEDSLTQIFYYAGHVSFVALSPG